MAGNSRYVRETVVPVVEGWLGLTSDLTVTSRGRLKPAAVSPHSMALVHVVGVRVEPWTTKVRWRLGAWDPTYL